MDSEDREPAIPFASKHEDNIKTNTLSAWFMLNSIFEMFWSMGLKRFIQINECNNRVLLLYFMEPGLEKYSTVFFKVFYEGGFNAINRLTRAFNIS